MDGSAWKYYREHFLEGLEQAMESEEYGREEIHAYLEQAGGIRVTKTHGRRSVAGLNQMDNCLWKIPALVKKGQLFQPVHCHEVNRERCRMSWHHFMIQSCSSHRSGQEPRLRRLNP